MASFQRERLRLRKCKQLARRLYKQTQQQATKVHVFHL